MSRQRDPFQAPRQGNFRKFLAARLYFGSAMQMQFVLAGWLIYQYTHQALSLGILGLCEAVPVIAISFIGGHIADIISRRKIIITCIAVLSVTFAMLLTLLFYMERFNTHTIVFIIYTVIFITGVCRGFMSPAVNAFIVQTVTREALPNAMSWNSIIWQICTMAGPAVGGLLLGFFGKEVAYSVVLVLLLLALFNYIMIRHTNPQEISKKRDPLKTSLTTGLRFVFGNPYMLGAFSLDLFAVLFGGVTAVLPMFASDILHVDARGFGFLRAAMAVGAISTGAVLTFSPPLRKSGVKLFGALIVFGLCMICFALSRNYYLSFALLVIAGMADEISVFIRSNVLQLMTPDNIRGRVSSVNTIFISSSNEIGAFESGTAAQLMGLCPSVIFGGCVTLLVVGIFMRITPELYKLDLRRLYAEQSKEV